MITQSDLAGAAAVAREVDLTTFWRETGRPSRSTIWITTDALGRIHIRSGRGTSPIVRSFARATAPSMAAAPGG